MKKSNRFVKLVMAGVMAAMAQPLLAGTVVKEVDADTLLVTRFEGKPPHQRLYINRNDNPEQFALYQEKVGVTPFPVFAVASRGAPGKSMPGTRIRVSSDITEITEIARFEEVEERDTTGRRWQGAPGKGMRIGR